MLFAGQTVSLPIAHICTTYAVRYDMNLLPSSDTFIPSAAKVLSASRCIFSVVLEHTMHVLYFVTPTPCQQAHKILRDVLQACTNASRDIECQIFGHMGHILMKPPVSTPYSNST